MRRPIGRVMTRPYDWDFNHRRKKKQRLSHEATKDTKENKNLILVTTIWLNRFARQDLDFFVFFVPSCEIIAFYRFNFRGKTWIMNSSLSGLPKPFEMLPPW